MVLPITGQFRAKVNQFIKDEWAGPIVVTKGIPHNTTDSNGFVTVEDDEITGYVLYNIAGVHCEILVLQSLKENCGNGRALINAVINTAKDNKCTHVWLITTNDNLHAIRYYQRFGFELVAVHLNALDESRKLKPAIPLLGNDNIPLKHEFEFFFAL